MALNFPTIDTAIATSEGFGLPTAPSITNGNNPGAIQYGSFAQSFGATGVAPNNAAIFPDLASGTAALDALVTDKINSGLNTPAALVNSWAPPDAPGNSPASTGAYIQRVASALGLGPNDPIPSPALQGGAQASNTGGSQTPPSPAATGIGGIAGAFAINPILGIGKAISTAASGAASGAKAVSWITNLSFSQIVVAILGVGMILGGIFFLRPVQSGITQIVRTGSKVAALAG